MDKIKYACVQYLDDKIRYYYEPIEFIFYKRNDKAHINPVNVSDYDAKHKYFILWDKRENSSCADDINESMFYEAYIICLGETEDDVKTRAVNKPKRFVFPKKLTSSDSYDESYQPKEDLKPKNSKLVKNIVQNENHQRTILKFKQQTLLNHRKVLSLHDMNKNNASTNEQDLNKSGDSANIEKNLYKKKSSVNRREDLNKSTGSINVEDFNTSTNSVNVREDLNKSTNSVNVREDLNKSTNSVNEREDLNKSSNVQEDSNTKNITSSMMQPKICLTKLSSSDFAKKNGTANKNSYASTPDAEIIETSRLSKEQDMQRNFDNDLIIKSFPSLQSKSCDPKTAHTELEIRRSSFSQTSHTKTQISNRRDSQKTDKQVPSGSHLQRSVQQAYDKQSLSPRSYTPRPLFSNSRLPTESNSLEENGSERSYRSLDSPRLDTHTSRSRTPSPLLSRSSTPTRLHGRTLVSPTLSGSRSRQLNKNTFSKTPYSRTRKSPAVSPIISSSNQIANLPGLQDRTNPLPNDNHEDAEETEDDPLAMLREYKPKLYKMYVKAGYDIETVSPETYRRYEIVDNKVYLGQDVEVGLKTWRLMNYKRKSGFLRDLGTVLWTKKTLARRCLDLKKLKNKEHDGEPIQLLTPRKVNLYLSLYNDYLNSSKYYKNLDDDHKDILIKNATESLSFHIRDEKNTTQ